MPSTLREPAAEPPFKKTPNYVQTLARGLDVIRAFDRDRPEMSLSEIAERVGLARAVVRRLLMTLEYLGFVGRRDRLFFLTPRTLELGYRYLASLGLPELAHPLMRALADEVDESCSMSVLDGRDIVYVQRIPVRKVMAVTLTVGARLPAYCASMGRVLLAGQSDAAVAAWLKGRRFPALTPFTLTDPAAIAAEIRRVREQGFARTEQEMELGLCSVAVPVRDGTGCVIAALNVGMPFREGARDWMMEKVLPALRVTSAAITQSWAAAHPARRP
ncbi:MAG: helix-turn-helix domain-containing protein [Gemmatimonadales bacterium]|nr:helix-turn-helix domain-containing protein [Gemmatimonadales bacterium]